MLSDEVIDKVIERLTNRIEQGNQYVLQQIGKKIKNIHNMTPTEARKLENILKYGGDYDKIVKKLKEITKLNVKDIEKIFREVAKTDYDFAKQFYDYRNKKYIPFDENIQLQRQIKAIAELTQKKYIDLSRTKAIGFSIRNNKKKIIFSGLKETYNNAIDKAILSVEQGKSTFYEQMHQLIKDIGMSGLKTLDYESGRTLRLDSAIRMHMNDTIKQLHNDIQQQIGKEFNSNGVEISVHLNPAPDHELVQGKQFSNIEFNKFQNDIDCYSYDGTFFPSEYNGHDRRSISEYNCRHYTFSIILGVNIPQYSNEQLQEIIDRNDKGFMFDNKHYSMYEGVQLQREIEREIRKQKDLKMFGLETGDNKLVNDSQHKIRLLNKKYKQLSEVSNLPTKMNRLRVSGYKRIKIMPSENIVDRLSKYNIKVDDSLLGKDMDKDLVDRTLNQVETLVNKYPVLKNKIKEDGLTIETDNAFGSYAGKANITGEKITLSKELYTNKNELIAQIKEGQDDNWSAKVNKENYDIYNITHETGHILEDAIMKERIKKSEGVNLNKLEFSSEIISYQHQDDVDIFNELFLPVSDKENISWASLQEKYISDYGKSASWFEWFAELFTKMELGEEDIMTKALKEYLEGELWKK